MNYDALKQYMLGLSEILWAKPYGDFKNPCIVVTKNSSYPSQLWDWGNWANNVALRQIAEYQGRGDELLAYEKGSVMNFLSEQYDDGRIEIAVFSDKQYDFVSKMPHRNVHKPVLCQHVAFIVKYHPEEVAWVREIYPRLKAFLTYYEKNAQHESGLYYFFDDFAIGVDNDPSTFYRPDNSSASIFINTLMLTELGAMAHLAALIGNEDDAREYKEKQQALKNAINEHCWDEKDGMYYSCDINLRPVDPNVLLHSGAPRHYSTLIQRLGCWSSFLPMWAGLPTKEQAERIVQNLLDEKGFWAPYGVRSLSKYEKMYRLVGTGNPSSWQGGVWILSNYFVFKALLKYGYKTEAEDLAKKTLDLLALDLEKTGAFHEYYDPETGDGLFNKGFSSWNLLAFNMLEYFEGKELIEAYL